MPTAYHVDAFGQLIPGQVLELQRIDGATRIVNGQEFVDLQFRTAPSATVGTMLTRAQWEDLRAAYPRGLSRHGAVYLFRFPMQDGRLNQNWFFEFVAEVVRSAQYPERPSRLESICLCETVEDARRFAAGRRNKPYSIVRVEYDSGFRADMNLLSGLSMVELMSNARRYWEGAPGLKEPFWEIIAPLPVRVAEVIEVSPPSP